QFIFAFSLIVTVHEFGHYIAARMCGCRIDKFYLFFNPWVTLYKKKIGHTEYGIGWLPFGGYVKIAGMMDESMDKSFMNQKPQPWEFRSKSGWQKLFIMLNGVLLNIILGMIIYIGLLWHNGEMYQPATNLPYGIAVMDSVAYEAGFKDGDQLISINGKTPKKFREASLKILVTTPCRVEVKRDNDTFILLIPNDFIKQVIKKSAMPFIQPRMELASIDSIMPHSTAEKIALQKGDNIVAINQQPISYFHDFSIAIRNYVGKTLDLTIQRENQIFEIKQVKIESNKLGVGFNKEVADRLLVEKKYSFFQAIPAGIVEGVETLKNYVAQLKLIFFGKINFTESVGGPISMGKMFPAQWNWEKIWFLTAFFSIAIGLMNLLPIPGLDGGHALFAIYEIITGRTPSPKIMEILLTIGFVLLIGFMVLVIGLDIWRLFK
ncbi:MAG: RIP metalloprotease RseP, partial [Chitinophagaceae bacterium]